MSGFMDTFFFLSLGIAFVLILLLVYHFKQRLSATESKCDTMFEIINGLVAEINGIKGALVARPPPPLESIQGLGIPPGHMFSHMSGGEHPPVVHHGENSLTKIQETESDDEVEEEEEEEDSDDVFDSDDEMEEDNSDNDSQRVLGDIDTIERIVVSDNEDDLDSSIVEIPINNASNAYTEGDDDFAKMTLPKLKAYITEKGLVEDAKKMKKAEILDLLKKQEVNVEA